MGEGTQKESQREKFLEETSRGLEELGVTPEEMDESQRAAYEERMRRDQPVEKEE